MKTKNRIKRRQFSLLEIIIAISIVALIAAIAVPNLLGSAEEAKVNTAKTEINNIKSAIIQYKIKEGKFPESLASLTTAGGSKTSYLKNVPKDPWKNEYQYELAPESHEGFEITSFGADGNSGGEGVNADIKLSEL